MNRNIRKTIVCMLSLMAVFAASPPSRAASAMLDCGYDDQGRYTVHSVDSTSPGVGDGIQPSDNCLEAIATVASRLHAVAPDTSRVRRAFAKTHDAAGVTGCDIWLFSSNGVDDARNIDENSIPLLLFPHAMLLCGIDGSTGKYEVRTANGFPEGLTDKIAIGSNCLLARQALRNRISKITGDQGDLGTPVSASVATGNYLDDLAYPGEEISEYIAPLHDRVVVISP